MIIYKATNLVNDKIYIGQTTKKLSYRINEHKKTSRNELKTRNKSSFPYAIKQFGIQNFKFEVIKHCVDILDLHDSEKFFINTYNSTDINIGYNLTTGGNGGFEVTQSYKDLCIEISLFKIPIVVYKIFEKSTSLLKASFFCKFDSINDASRKLNVDSKNINRVLKDKRKSTKGYIFRYGSSYLESITIPISNTRVKIIQYDKIGNLINRFDSISIASKLLKIDNKSIHDVLNKKRTSTRGFVFIREGETLELKSVKIESTDREDKKQIFYNIDDAVQKLNIKKNYIKRVLDGKRKYTFGYSFKYKK